MQSPRHRDADRAAAETGASSREQILFAVRQIVREMWFLPAAFSLVAVLVVVIAYYSASLAWKEPPFEMPADAVSSLLSILAASMLSVAVFSLSTLVSALASATQNTTPRAVPLIVADRTAQTAISTFIGAFMFSIVGIIGLSAGIYSQSGRLLLFLVTLAVTILVVVALIRWIGQVSKIGRVGETIGRIEAAAAHAFEQVGPGTLLNCVERTNPEPADGHRIFAASIGYVQHVNPDSLQHAAEDASVHIVIGARPGTYVDPSRPLALVQGVCSEELEDRIRGAFVVGDRRTFDEDPRFGLIVLSEVASRALSPAINDPGTAIDVIGTLIRVIADKAIGGVKADDEETEVNHRVAMRPLRRWTS